MAEHDQEAWPSQPDRPEAVARPEQPDQQRVRAMLDEARAEADRQRGAAEEYLGMLQRVKADFVNYKRRTEAERETQAEAARAETILAFLPVVDDLERALAHVPTEANRGWVEGLRLIERNLKSAFERIGLRRIGTEGELFDPNIHEAVAYEEHPSQPEGHIATVQRSGYQLGDRIVRPAQVSVSRNMTAQEPRGRNAWPRHKGHEPHGNGDVDPSEFRQPRNIDRA